MANETGVLAGRTPGISLSKRGSKQAKTLVKYLSSFKFDVIVSSPLERCLQTIEPYLKKHQLTLREMNEFQEMDYGSWSGKELKKLSKKKDWQVIQERPETFTFPNGESFNEAATRVRVGLKKIEKENSNQSILVVSHGDIIKMATTVSLGLPLKNFQKLTIEPASLTSINLVGQKLLFLNQKAGRRPRTRNMIQGFLLGGDSDK
jgi:probable phosphoglycerate mutase